jgi:hypothetical protein
VNLVDAVVGQRIFAATARYTPNVVNQMADFIASPPNARRERKKLPLLKN